MHRHGKTPLHLPCTQVTADVFPSFQISGKHPTPCLFRRWQAFPAKRSAVVGSICAKGKVHKPIFPPPHSLPSPGSSNAVPLSMSCPGRHLRLRSTFKEGHSPSATKQSGKQLISIFCKQKSESIEMIPLYYIFLVWLGGCRQVYTRKNHGHHSHHPSAKGEIDKQSSPLRDLQSHVALSPFFAFGRDFKFLMNLGGGL
ncbi:hypothetical protein K437DRAFT_142517 [Tilletiaria anomala UBC 951]|uniref:Uncharacterized protein n=1 Tax=Tilletiaria anomala (strain ATCC 24038 / CBS 436.72 / UBC 951) TaxID=1037660 RepID=A0A066VZ32_TILAU|nr:uncharacterized protein K437DRAFT_142517 [Tilletiaria anomala UBC 951]KDN44074.1 hypothetical protein K437DRAFT_142517 [Tilletiaria anomala UBC 951]